MKVLMAEFQYLGIVFVAPSWCVAAIHSAGLSRHLNKRRLALMLIIPVVTLAAALTNPLHGLLRREVSLSPDNSMFLQHRYGLLFWINNQYAWILLLCGTVLLLRNVWDSPALLMGQRSLMVLSVLIPWVANVKYVIGLGPLPQMDLTPCAFVLSGFILFYGISRFRILDVVPIAREYVLERMHEGLFVLDLDSNMIDINEAGRQILGLSRGSVLGLPAREAFSKIPALQNLIASRGGEGSQFELSVNGDREVYEARLHVLKDDQGASLCRI